MSYRVKRQERGNEICRFSSPLFDFIADPFFRLSNQNLTVWFSSVAAGPEMASTSG